MVYRFLSMASNRATFMKAYDSAQSERGKGLRVNTKRHVSQADLTTILTILWSYA